MSLTRGCGYKIVMSNWNPKSNPTWENVFCLGDPFDNYGVKKERENKSEKLSIAGEAKEIDFSLVA